MWRQPHLTPHAAPRGGGEGEVCMAREWKWHSDFWEATRSLTSRCHAQVRPQARGLCVKAHSQSRTLRAPRRRLPSRSSGRWRCVRPSRRPVGDFHTRFRCVEAGTIQSPGSSMRLEAAARMDVFRKLWKARKLILVVFIPLSLLPLPLIHPTSVSTTQWILVSFVYEREKKCLKCQKVVIFKLRVQCNWLVEFKVINKRQ